MRSAKTVALILVLISGLAFAEKKPKKGSMPEAIGQAKYIYVQAAGGDEFSSGVTTEDRLAIADVRDALKAWGRYTYMAERDKADLVFVVRRGRPSNPNAGMDMGEPPEMGSGRGQGTGGSGMGRQTQGQRTPGVTPQPGGVGGSDDDMLEVCQVNANGKLTKPLWSRSLAHGLSAPRVLLVAQFAEEVEKTYPKAAEAQPAGQKQP